MEHTSQPKGKGKEIARGDQDERDQDLPQPKKHKTSRSKNPKQSAEQQGARNKPTPTIRMKKMKHMEFEQTKWADHALLGDLGILDEVQQMFMNMGLAGLFNMAHEAYASETHQFLATLTLYDDTSLDIQDENRGQLHFKINGRDYVITLAQLGLVFGFPPGGEVYTLGLNLEEAQGVWALIAQGEYKKGVSKASTIRHPAIRYAHKFLAHTLFARRETGGVKEDELALIIEGIKPIGLKTARGNSIIGQPKRINLAHYLARRFLFYQEWVTSNKDKTPQLSIGGLITPILRACAVPLRGEAGETSIMRLDAPYLAVSYFLVGRLNRTYLYRFTVNTAKKTIILPNHGLTGFTVRDNLLFNPQLFQLYQPTRDGQFAKVGSKQPAPQPQEEEEEEPNEEVTYGSKRYDFEPYSEPVSGPALQAAHHHISLLQRLTKWQGKQIKKLVKTVKKQGKMIKKLLNSPTKRREDVESSLAMVLSGPEEEEARRQSRKGKAPISPSSSDSGNPCYSMDSSPSHSD